jgi:hypothetical protein
VSCASHKERRREAISRERDVDDRVFIFSRDMIAHEDEYRSVFRAMVGKRSGAVVQQLIRKRLIDLVRDDGKLIAPPGDADSASIEGLVRFVGGVLFGLLLWWLDGKARLSEKERNQLFRSLAIAAVKSRAATNKGR